FKSSEDPERTVEDAALGHGIEMTSRRTRVRFRVDACGCTSSPDVAHGIDSAVESVVFESADEVIACPFIRVRARPHRSSATLHVNASELRVRLDVSTEPVVVDLHTVLLPLGAINRSWCASRHSWDPAVRTYFWS